MRDLKSLRTAPSHGKWLRLRVMALAGLFLVLLGGTFWRAVVLQVVQREKLKGMAQDQYVRQVEIPARRGDIFDRRAAPLAQSVEVDSIWVDPSMQPDVKAAARELAKKLKLEPAELIARLEKGKRFAWVKRQAKPSEVAAVTALGLPGIGFTKEPKRFYPQRELGAHLIGMVGTDGRGLDGLELAFEDELSGSNSRLKGLRDAKGRQLLMSGVEAPAERQGATVTLTLDRHLQYLTEKALSHAVDDAKAAAGMAVMMDPKTGEILALANYPFFNPNMPTRSHHDNLRNRAALDAFEPGSTFKSFMIAAALEEKAITADQGFFCEDGSWNVGRHTIHDTHPHGWLNAGKILQVSSNIGAAKVAQVLGREKMVDYYARFGFGERAGLGLPGEGKGVIPFPKAEVQLATESFGQGLTATAVQLTAGYAALANSGVLMRPYLVSKVVDPDGVVLLENKPTVVRRVVSERTARKVVSMLEGVVEKEGTAPKARMEEYRVAGKTGTAQKVDPIAKGYSDKRIASFIGMVPAEDPRLVLTIVIDEPKTDVYGGLVAAPAFKEIAAAAMPYLGITPSGNFLAAAPSPVATSSSAANAAAAAAKAAALARAEVPEEVTEQVDKGNVKVPDLSGVVGRTAVVRLLGAALEPRLSGSGRVVAQKPVAGTLVEKGSRVTLELASRQ